MNETKKRGRPSNAEIAARAEPLRLVVDASAAFARAQAYALRVWNGQSADTLSRSERVERVISALKGQNLPTEGIELP